MTVVSDVNEVVQVSADIMSGLRSVVRINNRLLTLITGGAGELTIR